VDFKYFVPALEVGQGDVHLAVKPARADQGWIEDVDAVGAREHDDT
jgi:hypothetical protein